MFATKRESADMKTAVSVIFLMFVVIVWSFDAWVAHKGDGSSSISAIVLDTARTHPIVAVAAGMLMGHLFWPQ